jgi:hypothetical protein
MKTVKCRISEVSLKNNETLLINIEAEKEFNVEDFIELTNAAEELGNGRRFYNLINVGALTLPNKEARELSCSLEGSAYKKADAFVINSLPQKIMANVLLKINRPTVPTKFFSQIDEAEKWLQSLRINEHFAV